MTQVINSHTQGDSEEITKELIMELRALGKVVKELAGEVEHLTDSIINYSEEQ